MLPTHIICVFTAGNKQILKKTEYSRRKAIRRSGEDKSILMTTT